MNGQYLMNKEVSVQYAYKKDGKGERHGDAAERMLAAQARKHNVQPQVQPLPPQMMGGSASITPSHAMDGENIRAMNTGTPDFAAGRGGMPMANGGYPNMPPVQAHRPMPPQPLTTPPPGLPARPPPPQSGYVGPPPGFAPPPRFPQTPPAGFAPPAMGGHGAVPPPLPPGFQQAGYGRGR